MNLLIVKKLNHPHTTKEGKFANHAGAIEKVKKQKLQENMESVRSQKFHTKKSHKIK